MSRPLLVIFLTIFVNLVGFGIIIPLLPFYAETFGASPLVIGLLFASFSLGQLHRVAAARRPLRSLGPPAGADLQPARHGRQLRDAGGRAQPGDAVRGAHRRRPVGRQHHDRAGLHRRHHHRGEPRASLRGARRRLRSRLHRRAGARRGVRRRSATPRRSGRRPPSPWSRRCWRGAGCPRPCIARTPAAARRGGRSASSAIAPALRRLFAIDFVYWMSFAVYQTTFALFGARRFGFDATHTGYLFSAFGVLGVIVQGGLVGPVVRRLGTQRTLMIGLVFAALGWGGSALTYTRAAVRRAAGAGGDRHRLVQCDADRAGEQRRRIAASRGASRGPPARSRASAAPSVRSGATRCCSGSARAPRTAPPRRCCSAPPRSPVGPARLRLPSLRSEAALPRESQP